MFVCPTRRANGCLQKYAFMLAESDARDAAYSVDACSAEERSKDEEKMPLKQPAFGCGGKP